MSSEPILAYRLANITDPEERLEDAAMWKALHDEYGSEIVVLEKAEEAATDLPVFGRNRKRPDAVSRNPVSMALPYWNDPAFLQNCRRRFTTVSYDDLSRTVEGYHQDGLDVFIKSTRQKHAIFHVPVGTDVLDVMEAMVYSFIDGGPELMVQEQVEMRYEHRFFCIDREIVAFSPVQWGLTPLNYPLPEGTVYATPSSTEPENRSDIQESLLQLAQSIGKSMATDHAAIDCAMVNGKPGCIEFNPMQIGSVGLYASDVRAIAKASRKLIRQPIPAATPAATAP